MNLTVAIILGAFYMTYLEEKLLLKTRHVCEIFTAVVTESQRGTHQVCGAEA